MGIKSVNIKNDLTYEMEKSIKKIVLSISHYLSLKTSTDSSNKAKFNYTPFLIIGNLLFLIT